MIMTKLSDGRTMVKAFLASPLPLSFDIETTELNPRAGKMIAIQFQQGKIPTIFDVRDQSEEWGRVFAPLFDGRLLILGANLKFDGSWLREKYGIRMRRVFDVMLAEMVLYGAETGKGYSLKAIADRRGVVLPTPMDKADREWFYNLDERTEEWAGPFPKRITDYMSNDVRALFPIYEQQCKELQEKHLIPTAQLEFKTLPAVIEMECNGVQLDVTRWAQFIREKELIAYDLRLRIEQELGPYILASRAKRVDGALWRYDTWANDRDAATAQARINHEQLHLVTPWGEYKTTYMQAWRAAHPNPHKPKDDTTINIGSDEQIKDALRELGIPIPMKRKKGAKEETESVDDESLEQIEARHPAIPLLRQYNKADKFVKSYGATLLAEQDAKDGRFHFKYTQMVSTGRMSASRIQQIPSKGDGKRLRQNVVAAPGNVLIVLDYNAIEMRILAEIAKEPELIDAFATGADIHSTIARRIFHLPPDADTKATAHTAGGQELKGWTYRDLAKTFEYGAVYGVGPTRIAKLLGIARDEATDILQAFFEEYNHVANYMHLVRHNAKVLGESRTVGERARYYHIPPQPHQDARTWGEYRTALQEWRGAIASVERAAGNHPIQGTSADMIKSALSLLYERLFYELDTVKLVACVHDEIVVECKAEDAAQVGTLVSECMELAGKTYLKRVPVPVPFVEASYCWEK